jgi:hypothetical protein
VVVGEVVVVVVVISNSSGGGGGGGNTVPKLQVSLARTLAILHYDISNNI